MKMRIYATTDKENHVYKANLLSDLSFRCQSLIYESDANKQYQKQWNRAEDSHTWEHKI